MEIEETVMRRNFDTPWKDILDVYFEPFLTSCHPEASRAINWDKGYEPLDKELNSITKEAETGKRIADKLMKVFRADGEETWVLLHIEIQGQVQSDFSERMYTYHYRLFDRYHKPIVSIAVLADDKLSWRPSSYQHHLWGCEVRFDFVSIKLLDYETRQEELKSSTNPFSIVLLAHLAALKTKGNQKDRYTAKLGLTRSLYDKGWDKKAILDLYTFIDWVIALPESLELEYLNEIEHFEQEKHMKYITSAERIGIQKGMQQGIKEGVVKGLQQGMEKGKRAILLRQLQRKFGSIPAHCQKRIEKAHAEELLDWADTIITADSLQDIFK